MNVCMSFHYSGIVMLTDKIVPIAALKSLLRSPGEGERRAGGAAPQKEQHSWSFHTNEVSIVF